MGILLALNSIGRTKRFVLTLILLTPIISKTEADFSHQNKNFQTPPNKEDVEKQLPFCGDESQRSISRRLLYVTTLDGKLSALDVSKDGNVHWSIKTGPGSLLSSSIHRLELTNNGQWVRMIPSLSGGLYKFDGDSIDPIPITAENLLSSSFKFSDDLVISGGKETRSYGVSARTGQVLYECSMLNGCNNSTDDNPQEPSNINPDMENVINAHDPLVDDVLVVRRQTQTVRAVEPRTGTERWNFSVGHHELDLLKSSDCHERHVTDIDMLLADLEIKVVVPEGLICAFHKSSPNEILWKQQFDHPIVSAWQTDTSYNLKTVDLFSSAQWVWNGVREDIIGQEGLISPSIYLGMFQKQLYIQESQKLQKFVVEQANKFTHHLISSETNFPQIPWKPLPATSSGLALITADISSNGVAGKSTRVALNEDNKAKNDNEDHATTITALSVLYASEYVNGNGFYLYSSSDLNRSESALCDSSNTTKGQESDYVFNFIDEDTPAKIIIVSLWFWWKEILVISLTTAILLNILFSPKLRGTREVVIIERQVQIAAPPDSEIIEDPSSSRTRSSQRSLSESNTSSNENFTSRFLNDFDLVQCLGKGGFGVVFEAKNKIDDCCYAIKRIMLPNKKESRDRVMREVKTLANCEHQNIVRYFQAWVENPPPGWQETEDQKWMERDILSTSIDIETPDGTTLPPFSKNSVFLNNNNNNTNNNNGISNNFPKTRKLKNETWVTKFKGSNIFDIENELCNSIRRSSLTLNNNDNDEDESSSFIQFKDDTNDNTTSSLNNSKLDDSQSNYESKDLDKDDDDSDSFEIEFKHSTNGFNKNDIISTSANHISSSSSNNKSNSNSSKFSRSFSGIPKKRGHIRPMSLDLTSQGNVIVPVPTKNQSKVYLYIQMQLCRKQSLREWLREHKAEMRRPSVRNVFEQIVDAVDYVHLKGLIHRDLKPSNIFFSLDGQIKIGDFGLVTDMSDNATTKRGLESGCHTQQVGTHLYMSPEQLDGLPYDFKVDIFSLGLIFFELLVDFGTEMERIQTLKSLRSGHFPKEFLIAFSIEYNLLKLMLSGIPYERPTTFQIKERLNSMTDWLKHGGDDTGDIVDGKIPSLCLFENYSVSTTSKGDSKIPITCRLEYSSSNTTASGGVKDIPN